MVFLKKKTFFIILIFLIVIFLLGFYFLRQPEGVSSEISWGAAFSKPFTEKLGLDWQETYLAILDDLGVKKLRIPLYWPDIEPEENQYFFDDYDWLIKEAEKRGVQIILVLGRRLPRWPECHIPDWARSLDEKSQQVKILDLIKEVVERYKEKPSISTWQVENEPFLKFGKCPPLDVNFLEKEIFLVRSLDPSRKIIITDGGEFGLWLRAAKRADIFGTTIYRIVWSKFIGYFKYPLLPRFFWLKANFLHLFYPQKQIIVSELQTEPWGPKLIYQTTPEEHFKSMNFEQFLENIAYAKKVGFPEVYLWGTEWWYWLKEKYNIADFWQKAKELFIEN